MRPATLLLALLTLVPILWPRLSAAALKSPQVELRSRTLNPGVDGESIRSLVEQTTASRHVLAQLAAMPDSRKRHALAEAGLTLQGYLPEKAFIARLEPGGRPEALRELGVTWLGSIAHRDKLAPALAQLAIGGTGEAFGAAPGGLPTAANLPAHARLPDGKIAVYVEFHRDVGLASGSARLREASGATVVGQLRALNGALVLTEPSALAAIVLLDEVKWIEPASPAMHELNDGIREATGVDRVHAPPLDVRGRGITVLVYDGGLVCAHPDLGARVTAGENGFQSTHATHVAGTLGGDGTSSDGQYRGVAPAIDIVSYMYESCDPMCLYNNPQDLEENYEEGMALFGAHLATNSLGSNISANGYDCDLLGDYENTARLLDAIARGALGRPFLSIWAAGNERGGLAPCGELYFTTGVPATAKNTIVVGATLSDDLTIADFSSLGPVDDGRMRPDLVAPGCERGGDRGITSLRACSGHGLLCGTSMSTPVVAGIAALVSERLRASPRGEVILPAAMKAILACSSRDLGPAGPDYTFGYGQVDARAAIDLVDRGAIIESQVSHQETVVHEFVLPAEREQLRVVLAWDDEPGEPLSGRNLVNDLDLRLVDPEGTTHHPFVLNPQWPGEEASRGPNRRDPSEMVEVDGAAAGNWRVEVAGFSVPSGPQTFALAIGSREAAAPIAVAEEGGAVLEAAGRKPLARNVPNPFNPTTSIQFVAGGGRTSLRIFDLRGRLVRTLVDGALPPGRRHVAWDGRDDSGQRVASGVYVYALSEGGESYRGSMVLAR